MRAGGRFGLKLPVQAAQAMLAVLLLAGCTGFVNQPQRPALYDFGPVAPAPVAATAAASAAPGLPLPPLVLAEIDASAALDGTAVLYRLGYADANQLLPYAQSRWSAPPAQLVRQRLRELLGRETVVLNPGEAAGLSQAGGRAPRLLRLELEEFSHWFDSPKDSAGVLRLRATLSELAGGGERLLAQRSFTVRRAAPTPDAPGGVRGLAAAVDAAAGEMAQWLRAGGAAPAAGSPG